MSYISRAIEPTIKELMEEYSALLICGPRQVGKTTVLKHIIDESKRKFEEVTLDNLEARSLAINDPAMFFQVYKPPILIDEVQYAPELFAQIKIMIDKGATPASFLLTGSQQFRLMELAGETLAGRIGIVPMSSFSLGETMGHPEKPFEISLDFWKRRSNIVKSKDVLELFDLMHKGSMPAVVSREKKNIEVYYSSYVQTYIERDVRRILGDVDAILFADFLRAVGARCSQILNVASIAGDVGIRPEKAKVWLSVLEKSGVIFFLRAYSNNNLKRIVKAPKLYCHDSGLIAYLTKWKSGQTMEAGAMAGAFFENFVVSQIWKSYINACVEPPMYYLRNHDGNEIDVVIESDGFLNPVEIKKTASPNKTMTRSFAALDRTNMKRGTGAIVCASQTAGAIDSGTLIIPASLL